MAVTPVTIQWGPNFANSLNINDLTTYISKAVGVWAGPERAIVLADTTYNSPYKKRTQLKERVFSITTTIRQQPWSSGYNAARNDLLRALCNGPVRVVLTRTGVGYVYLEAECEHPEEVDEVTFNCKFTASDPVYRVTPDPAPVVGNTTVPTPPAGTYNTLNLPAYVGSAVAEPVISLEVRQPATVYVWRKTITITNPNAFALSYYPICLDLGDLRTLVGASGASGSYPSARYWTDGTSTSAKIKDIRLETQGGARKQIYLRDSGDTGGTWHQSVKVWFVLYSLAAGETKTLYLLHGNPSADGNEIWNEAALVKPMFNMYNSSNTLWEYSDFRPIGTNPTRNSQWDLYQDAINLAAITFPHGAFDYTGSGMVPCAGGRVPQHANSRAGFAGLSLTSQVPIASVAFTYRYGSNFKDPFILRSQRPDGRIVDDFVEARDFAMLASLRVGNPGANNQLHIDNLTRSASAFHVGDWVAVGLNTGATYNAIITSINTSSPTDPYLVINTNLPSAADTGNPVQGFYVSATTTRTYNSGDQPQFIAFGLRADQPDLASGEWFFGAADLVDVTPNSTTIPQITIGSDVQLVGVGSYQLRGQFGNPATGEYLNVNTILNQFDKLVIDCANREVWYYQATGDGVWMTPVRRMESLSWQSVGLYWVHIDPALSTNSLQFVVDPARPGDTNFQNLQVSVTFPVRYY